MQVSSRKTFDYFKQTPENCWIITEGIAGTENQCIAVAERLGIPYSVKRIALRQPFRTLCPHIFKTAPEAFIQGINWTDPAPDLIIASGRKAVPVALHFKHAFRVFIQDPKVNPSYFDLVAAPLHDGLEGENVIQTTAAPNRITPQLLTEAKSKHDFTSLPHTRIAVLIGGNSKTHRMPEDFAQRLERQLSSYLNSEDYGFMVTASRRTPEPIINALKAVFDRENCFYWDGQGDNPYHAYLAYADYILVTEDSTSMLSDAYSTGKPVYRLPLEGGSDKFNRLYRALENRCGGHIFNGGFEPYTYDPLDDAQLIADEIKKRFEKHTTAT